jgi:hypothetical protein
VRNENLYRVMHQKRDKSIFKIFSNEKSKKKFYSLIGIFLPDNTAYVENMVAGFLKTHFSKLTLK